jgi:gamma-glutamyl-gamma-aminobutyrate hydrolase PuuD
VRLVAVSQRVDLARRGSERRDALDQNWTRFLGAAGLRPLLIPNDAAAAREMVAGLPVAGVLLTGGNDLAAYGGDAPERDAAETALIEWALAAGRPLLGVCRGMQMLQHFHGIRLEPVDGHVAPRQEISVNGGRDTANSYHTLGARVSVPELTVWAQADDGVVKALRHRTLPLLAIMWHPERFAPFRARDVALFRGHFGGGNAP